MLRDLMPTSVHQITLDDAEVLFRSRMGLIYGPGITFSGFFEKLAQDFALKWGGHPEQNYNMRKRTACAEPGCRSRGSKEGDPRLLESPNAVSTPQTNRQPEMVCNTFPTLDSAFERELDRACERRPSASRLAASF